MSKLQEQPLLYASTIVLSLIGNSLGVLLFLGSALFFSKTKEKIISVSNITSMDGITPLYFFILSGLCLLALLGVIKMKKWQKVGFYYYFSAQLALLFLPVIWLNWNAFSIINLIFSLLFTFIYLSFFRQMS